MRRKQQQAGKTLVPLLGIFSALAVAVAAVAIVLRAKEQDRRVAVERALEQARGENLDLQARLQDTQRAKVRVEGELTQTRKELDEAKEQMAKAVEAQTTLSRSLQDREHELERLTKELAQTKDAAQQTAAQLAQLQGERDTIKQQLDNATQAKGDAESKVAELTRPTVLLENVVVTNDQAKPAEADMSHVASPDQGTPPAAAQRVVSGQVVVVNREYDFIVMNLGKHHGLSVGQEFHVVRDNQVLGKVKVEKVYDELSAATILPESQKNNIREGDLVRAL